MQKGRKMKKKGSKKMIIFAPHSPWCFGIKSKLINLLSTNCPLKVKIFSKQYPYPYQFSNTQSHPTRRSRIVQDSEQSNKICLIPQRTRANHREKERKKTKDNNVRQSHSFWNEKQKNGNLFSMSYKLMLKICMFVKY